MGSTTTTQHDGRSPSLARQPRLPLFWLTLSLLNFIPAVAVAQVNTGNPAAESPAAETRAESANGLPSPIAHPAVSSGSFSTSGSSVGPYGYRGVDGYTDSQDASLGYRYGDGSSPSSYQPSYAADGTYRQPSGLVILNERWAVVPTKLTGELYALQLPELRVAVAYQDTKRSFGKAVRISDTACVVLDLAASSAVVFQIGEEGWRPIAELPCPGTPNSLVWDADSSVLFVTGQWSQRLYRFQANHAAGDSATGASAVDNTVTLDPTTLNLTTWTTLPTTDLPMCGGVILPLKQHSAVLVMDAFGRDFAIVDLDSASVIKHAQVYGHNISQIVSVDDGQRVMYTHQLLNEFAQSMRGDITWGGLLSNNIRWLKTERMLNETGADIFSQGKFYPVGVTGDGAGDPTSFALTEDGALAVTLGGTDRVAMGHLRDLDLRQVHVGQRPIACAFTPDAKQLIVVNQFSDNLSIVDVSSRAVTHVPLGALRQPTEVEVGERFFFHSKLAHDGWMSCHSCHSQGHTNGQLNDNLTDGTFGSPKRILSLLGQAETAPYSWSGKFESLDEQVFHSIRSTMATDNPIDEGTVKAIATYVRTLPAPPSVLAARQAVNGSGLGLVSDGQLATVANDSATADKEGTANEKSTAEYVREALLQGGSLFQELGCRECHAGDHYTSRETYDVGLADEQGLTRFNPPSLLAVSQRAGALFHDGRATSLEAVVADFRHQLPRELTSAEVEALVCYLKSL